MAGAVAPTLSNDLPAVVPASAAVIAGLAHEGATIDARVGALAVTDQAGLELGARLLADLQALQDLVDEDLGRPKAAAHALWKSLSSVYNKHAEPLAELAKRVKGKVGSYVEAEERRRRIEAAEAAERQRKADEEARLAEAIAHEAAGDSEAAEEILSQPPLPPPPPQVERPRAKGVATTERWSASITDMTQLVIAAAEGEAVAVSILLDERVIEAASTRASAMARALKQQLVVAGVRVHRETSVSRRAI